MRTLFRILILLLPTQLAIHYFPDWASVYGIRSDYLSPTLYFTDLILIVFIVRSFYVHSSQLGKIISKYKTPIIATVLFSFFNIYFSVNPGASVYGWVTFIKLVSFGMAVYLVEIDFEKDFLFPLSLSIAVVSSIGILQVLRGSTAGGVFYLLGERSFNVTTPGVALFSLNGLNHLRSYSIFSHPNSFAGYLVVSLLILLCNKCKSFSVLRYISIFLGLIALILSFSKTAYLSSVVLVLTYYLLKSTNKAGIVLSIAAVIFIGLSTISPIIAQKVITKYDVSNWEKSISERVMLLETSGELLTRNKFVGNGLKTIIQLKPESVLVSDLFWKLRPVHNVYLLIFVETGLMGLLGVSIYLLKSLSDNNALPIFTSILFSILFMGLADHYWITLQQNQLMFCLIFSFLYKYSIKTGTGSNINLLNFKLV